MSKESFSLFLSSAESPDYAEPSNFPDLTASLNFASWIMPVNNFVVKVTGKPEYYGLDPKCLIYQTLAHITGASYFDIEGPTRKTVLDFIGALCRKMNPEIDPETARHVSGEVLRAIDNRMTDRDLMGEAFENRSFDAKSGKWVDSSFRLVECGTNAFGMVCYRPTAVAYAILSPLIDINTEDRAALQAKFIADIATDQARGREIEIMLEGFVASLRELREKLNARLRDFFRKIGVERWHSEIVPLLNAAVDLIQRIQNDVAKISATLLSEAGEGKVIIANLVGQVNGHWAQLVNRVENAPYEYERLALKAMRFGDRNVKNVHDLMPLLLQADVDRLDSSIDAIFSVIMPAICPAFASPEDLMPLCDDGSSPETSLEQPLVQRKYEPLPPIWTDEEIEDTRLFLMEKILAGAASLADLLGCFDSSQKRRLVVHLVFGFFVSGMLNDFRHKTIVEDMFALANMEGDSFSFVKDATDV